VSSNKLLLASLLAWMLILCLAVANGALREAVLIPSLGKSAGLVLSGVLLSLLILVVAYGFVRMTRRDAGWQFVFVGVLWLSLTLAFEFGFGRWVQHKSWSDLLDAYTFRDGNLWPMVLLVTLVAPYLAAVLHATRARARSPAGTGR
jgi:hypothetical protein